MVITNIDVTVSGSYFEGSCMACEVPERGGMVTLIDVGPGQGRFRLRLCAAHTRILADKLARAGLRRNL